MKNIRDFGYLLEARKKLWEKDKNKKKDELASIELKMKTLDRNSIEYRQLEAKKIGLTLDLYNQDKQNEIKIERLMKKHEQQTEREQADIMYKFQASEIKKTVEQAILNQSKKLLLKVPLIQKSVNAYNKVREIYDSTKSAINKTKEIVNKTVDVGAQIVLTKKVGGKGLFHVGGRRVGKYNINSPLLSRFEKFSKNFDEKRVLKDSDDFFVQDGKLFYKKKGKFKAIDPESQLSIYDFYEYLKSQEVDNKQIGDIIENARRMNVAFDDKVFRLLQQTADIDNNFQTELKNIKKQVMNTKYKDANAISSLQIRDNTMTAKINKTFENNFDLLKNIQASEPLMKRLKNKPELIEQLAENPKLFRQMRIEAEELEQRREEQKENKKQWKKKKQDFESQKEKLIGKLQAEGVDEDGIEAEVKNLEDKIFGSKLDLPKPEKPAKQKPQESKSDFTDIKVSDDNIDVNQAIAKLQNRQQQQTENLRQQINETLGFEPSKKPSKAQPVVYVTDKQLEDFQTLQTGSIINMDDSQRQQFFDNAEAVRNAKKINDENIENLKEVLADFYVNCEAMKKEKFDKQKPDEKEGGLISSLTDLGKGAFIKQSFKTLGKLLLRGAGFLFLNPVGLGITALVAGSLYFFGPWLKDKLSNWWNSKGDNESTEQLAESTSTEIGTKINDIEVDVDSNGKKLDEETKQKIKEISEQTGKKQIDVLFDADSYTNEDYQKAKAKYQNQLKSDDLAKMERDNLAKTYVEDKKAEINEKVEAGEISKYKAKAQISRLSEADYDQKQIEKIIRQDKLNQQLKNPTETKVQAEKREKAVANLKTETPEQKVARQQAFEEKINKKEIDEQKLAEQQKYAREDAEHYREAVYKYRWNKYKSGNETATKYNGYEDGKIYNKGMFGYDSDTRKKINDFEYFKKANADKIEKWERLGTNDTSVRLHEKSLSRGKQGARTYDERLNQFGPQTTKLLKDELSAQNKIAKSERENQVKNEDQLNRNQAVQIQSNDNFENKPVSDMSSSLVAQPVPSSSTPRYDYNEVVANEQQAGKQRAIARVNKLAQNQQPQQVDKKPLNEQNATIDNMLGGSGLNVTNYPRRAQ